MDRLKQLFADQGQSPWLDNLSRDALRNGSLRARVDSGIRGVTSNPSIFQKAITGSSAYDEQLTRLRKQGASADEAYWDLVMDDIAATAEAFAELYESSKGGDGYVSVEVDPRLAHDAPATIAAGRDLRARVSAPNVFIKVPATAEGVLATEALLAAGIGVNVTLMFGLERYKQILGAWDRGVTAAKAAGLPQPPSVASFFVSRVDTEIDGRLQTIGTEAALALRGRAAVAQAQMAYDLFKTFHAAHPHDAPQRPLWASTSTKNPAYDELLYVDSLIGPDTVNTLPDATIDAFVDHGKVARSVDADTPAAQETYDAVTAVGIDWEDVAAELERKGVEAFIAAVVGALDTVAKELKV